MQNARLILASGSAIRAQIMTAAGLDFDIIRTGVDEDAIKEACAGEGLSLEMTAQRLADAKALAATAAADAYVIGSDQILEYQGEGFDKPRDMAEARARLLALAGGSHTLINAISIVRGGAVIFRNLDRPRLDMRALTPEEVDAYLAAAGPEILASVGAYQIEQLGARLFERIDGDHFAVLGLSLYPVLRFLRAEGVLEF